MWWPPHQWYPYALVLALVATTLSGRRCNIIGVAIIFADFELAKLPGDQYMVLANICIDMVAAELTLAFCSGVICWQLMLTWAALMCAHAGYIYSKNQMVYWYTTSAISWAQAALLLVWGGIDGGKRVRRYLDSRMRGSRFRISVGALCRDEPNRAADEGASA
jgi:hypothetical protein